MSISPRISKKSGYPSPVSTRGTLRMVRTFSVTSSPRVLALLILCVLCFDRYIAPIRALLIGEGLRISWPALMVFFLNDSWLSVMLALGLLLLLFDVPPHCFVPAPKVTSTVVRLRVRKAPPVAVQDEKLLFTVVRAAFNQRRKTLINALSAGVPGCDKARAAAAVAACGFDARVRGETLSLAQFAALSDALGSEIG
mgnify:CR=1 FL=1